MKINISSFLKDIEVRRESHFFVFKHPHATPLQALFRCLQDLGYIGDTDIEDSDNGSQLAISTSDSHWLNDCPLYFSMKSFWERVANRNQMPDSYFILPKEDPEIDVTAKEIKCLLLWKRLLHSLSDHRGTEDSSTALIYYISTDQGFRKHLLEQSCEYKDLKTFDLSERSFITASKLLELMDLDDAHKTERRNVLRTTLSSLLDEENSQIPFAWITTQHDRLYKKFNENYEAYAHKFSVNKILSELDEKHNDYIQKVTDSLSSSQSKALAIPGAIIAIAALVRNDSLTALFLVSIGLIIVWRLTAMANAIYLESLNSLKEQITKTFDRFSSTKTDSEVKHSAITSKERLSALIKNYQSRLKEITALARNVALAGVTYSGYNAFLSAPENIKKLILSIPDCAISLFNLFIMYSFPFPPYF